MSIEKNLKEITAQDLQALITAAIREGKSIEYKERIAIATDEQKRKFVASIASFANASGGDLIFGIKAENGVPKAVAALPDFEPDRDVRVLRDIIRAHIDPPLFGVELKDVPVQGGAALVVRVPRAWDGAHMVTYNNDNRFYTRDANGRVLMNVPEIRSSFALRETMVERIRHSRLERLGLIRSQELPVALLGGAKLVLHLFPLQSFDPGYQPDLNALLRGNVVRPMNYMTAFAQFHDLDGVYVADVVAKEGSRGYSAVLRSGCVEVVQRVGRDQWIPNPECEQRLIEFFPQCVNWLRIMGLEPPAVVMLAILDAQGCLLVSGLRRPLYDMRPIKHRDVIMHDTFMSTFETPAQELLRPFCDAIWQSCGLERSFNFDSEGKWMPQTWD